MGLDRKPSVMFWVVAALAVAWNLFGVFVYVQQATLTPQAVQALPEAERALLLGRPAWATAAFAMGVFGGAAGSLLLLLRSRWALPVLALSLLGVVVQQVQAFGPANAYAALGPAALPVPATVLVVGIFLLFYARGARRRGWLN